MWKIYFLAYALLAVSVLIGFVSANRNRSYSPIVISTIIGSMLFGFVYYVVPSIITLIPTIKH